MSTVTINTPREVTHARIADALEGIETSSSNNPTSANMQAIVTALNGIASGITGGNIATNISYNNSTSGLQSTDVQGAIDELSSEKVDKVSGMGLSTNDYTTEEKTKLNGIEAGAEVNKQSDWNVSDTTDDAYIKNKPTTIAGYGITDTYTKTEVDSALNGKLNSSLKGANSGLAELDASGKVPSSQLPSYVDDVLEYESRINFPSTGESGKIYVAKDTNLTYRWSGSDYVEISPSLALGETSSTAYRGDRGKKSYDHATETKLGQTAQGFYKIGVTSEGHVASATPVTKTDITGLGIPAQDTTYSPATQSSNGLMSSTDKTKLDGIETGANKTIVDSALSTSSTNPVQNAVITNYLNALGLSVINGQLCMTYNVE